MEGHTLLAIRHSLSRSFTASSISNIRTSLAQNIRRHRRFSPPRRLSHQNAYSNAGRTDDSQAYPLTGYYSDILSARSKQRGQATTSPTAPEQKSESPPETPQQPQTPEERMAIVFGTRLAGPGRSSRYNPGTSTTWKTINGVPIPPRPEEPDNCCMSGCVHCVWDDYRDEMEEWAELLAQAKAKGGPTKSPKVIPTAIPKTPEGADSTSMDDDGGGSETNWSIPGPGDDLFADIPVGIREFMKTEKRLKQIHRQESSA